MSDNRRLVKFYVILAAVLVIMLNLILLFQVPDFLKRLW
jgi:hypothetical protein